MTRTRRHLLSLLAALSVLAAAGCFGGPPTGLPSSTATGPPPVYVAVGGSESVGAGARVPLLEAWPQVFYGTALPRRVVFVNLATDRAGVASALEQQVPLALPLEPALVTVWLNSDDIALGTPTARYESTLREIVRQLRRDGRTRVLLADTPDFSLTTRAAGLGAAALATIRATVDEYNAAVARVAEAEGATVVRLNARSADLLGPGKAASDGVSLGTESHVEAAAAFAEALAAAGGPPG